VFVHTLQKSEMKMSQPIRFEVCVDSVEGAVAAQQGGAHRVELCDNLIEGGTTPSLGTIEFTRQHISIGLQVIIRPRGGDFCYSELEFAVMKRDIALARQTGADGIVTGVLNPDGTVDTTRTGELIALARPLNVTFHRAFDMTRDPFEAVEALIALGVDRVLTSGQDASALEGLGLITALVRCAGDRIIVMPGGGITERNISRILEQTGAREVHFSGRATVESPMAFRNSNAFMGGALRPPEYVRKTTSVDRVQALIRAAG
jgi:copper homeostasis protein